MVPNLTLNQMRYLVALAEERNFVRAAQKCFVSQPALTMQLKQMESVLGAELVDRDKKPLILTEIGEKIVMQARLVLQETIKISELIENFKESVIGNIKLGIIPTIGPYLSPMFIPRLLEEYPTVQISMKERLTDEILEDLNQGELDAGIIVTPYSKAEEFKILPLFYEIFYAFVSPKHHLYNEELIDLNALNSDDLWLLSEGNCFRNQVLSVCRGDSAPKGARFHYVSSSIESLKKIVLLEGGMTILPELALPEKSGADKRIKLFSPTLPVRQVSLVVTRTFLKQRFIENIIEVIKSSIPESLNEMRGELVGVDMGYEVKKESVR